MVIAEYILEEGKYLVNRELRGRKIRWLFRPRKPEIGVYYSVIAAKEKVIELLEKPENRESFYRIRTRITGPRR